MRAVATLLLGLACLAAHAAAPDAIDAYIETEMAKRRIPGLAVAVIQKGVVTKLRGYGQANLEHDSPVTPDTVFELASLTKQFTAAAILLLVEEGKITLDDTIDRYLPPIPDNWRSITIRHLLTHTAGFPGLGETFRSLYVGGERTNYTTNQIFASAIKDPIRFPPGERWEYSDTGYFLLGMIIEKVSGQRYGAFLSERFFRPLGMTASSVVDQWVIVRNRATHYTLRDGQFINMRRHSQLGLASHNGALTSARDLARWEIALAGGKILKASSLDQMWTPLAFADGTRHSYGFAWWTGPNRLGRRSINHSGASGSDYSRYPDDNLTVIVLGNLGRFMSTVDVDAWGLTSGIAQLFIPGLSIRDLKEQPDGAGLTSRMRAFLDEIAGGGELEMMVPRLRAGVTPIGRKLTAYRMAQVTDFRFVACEDAQARGVERFGARVAQSCYFRMTSPGWTRYYTFHLTADGRVADYGSFLD